MLYLDKRMVFEILFVPLLTIILIFDGVLENRNREYDINSQILCHDDPTKCWINVKRN